MSAHADARWLAAQYQPGPRAAAMPRELSPQDEAHAYRIQSEVTQLLGERIGGWKVAMSDPDTGTSAPVFASQLFHSRVQMSSPIAEQLGVEPEIAFSLARDLPPLSGSQRYSRESVLDAIDSAHAAIEIVVSRFASHDGAPALDRLADSISNAGLLVGSGQRDWRRLDFATLPLSLSIQSSGTLDREHSSRGGHPLADPLLALIWLVNHLSARGLGLRRGDLVTTGSYAGLSFLPRGGKARVTFDQLAAVELINR